MTDAQDYTQRLRALLPPGSRVYMIFRGGKAVDFYAIDKDGPHYISGLVGPILRWPRTAEGAVSVGVEKMNVPNVLAAALWGGELPPRERLKLKRWASSRPDGASLTPSLALKGGVL
jgi:hypothetical protein